jgi:hypothetical protein
MKTFTMEEAAELHRLREEQLANEQQRERQEELAWVSRWLEPEITPVAPDKHP